MIFVFQRWGSSRIIWRLLPLFFGGATLTPLFFSSGSIWGQKYAAPAPIRYVIYVYLGRNSQPLLKIELIQNK